LAARQAGSQHKRSNNTCHHTDPHQSPPFHRSCAKDVGSFGSKGNSNTYLPLPLAHQIRKHSVNLNSDQDQGQTCQGSQEHCLNFSLSNFPIEQIIKRENALIPADPG
jgi:hypothetical protein